MRKNVMIRLLCLVVAGVVLSGAVAYAAVTGSPYETLKNAALDAITQRNVTVEACMTGTINGEVQTDDKTFYIASEDSCLQYYYDSDGEIEGYNYSTDGLSIYTSIIGKDGKQWYSAYISPASRYPYTRNYNSMGLISPEDRNSAKMRFFEVLADVLIGDLKNNISMSSSGGVREVRATWTESQMPELVKAGLDMYIEQFNSAGYRYPTENPTRDDYEGYDPLEIPMKSVAIEYVTVYAKIDADGNLLHIDFSGKCVATNIFGDSNELEVKVSANFTDIGTSNPECIIKDASKTLTAEYAKKRFGKDYITVYFTLNDDGTIDVGSVTTMYPGETQKYSLKQDVDDFDFAYYDKDYDIFIG